MVVDLPALREMAGMANKIPDNWCVELRPEIIFGFIFDVDQELSDVISSEILGEIFDEIKRTDALNINKEINKRR